MYIVKHSFRNFGKIYTAGSVITEPAGIKRFRCKLAEGKIIEVNEQNLEAYAEYFKLKYGVDIKQGDSAPEQPEQPEQPVVPKEPARPVVTPAPAKAVVKAPTTSKR